MLGERGLWYKMTFFEGAARVPLVVHAPERFAPRRVSQNVSLLDLYPTLVDLAGGDPETEPETEDVPGHSLVPLLEGDAAGWPDAVHGEYLAEGAAGPLVMVRRGAHKYVVGEDSPPRLFDLAADPRELNDLSGQASERARETAFAEEVARRWDFAELRNQVLASQRRRRRIFEALSQGDPAPWDYQAPGDKAGRYARNLGRVLGDLERQVRLPFAEEPPPDGETG
jgi:choline-sulfatase